MREKVLFNEKWLFAQGVDEAVCAAEICDESTFSEVTLPHDWSILSAPEELEETGAGGGYVPAGIGWYRKHFTVETLDPDAEYSFLFEGIYMDSTVYLNGHRVGSQGYGYSSFYVDVTEELRQGDNTIAVRVDNSHQPNSRWYSGSGIYRDVYLEKTAKVRFDHFGLRAQTNGWYKEQNEASLQILSQVKNTSLDEVRVGVLHKLYDAEGQLVTSSGIALALVPGEVSDCMTRPTVQEPHLWTDRDPYLYTLVSTVMLEGKTVDEIRTKIGIRTAKFDADRGFLLNGESVKIKGMCLHHDCGMTGAVSPYEVLSERLTELREMGCNGIRTAHNPPDPKLLDLCDEFGFLVMDEVYDEWYLSKNKNDNYYSESLAFGASMFFKRDAEKELTTMIRRDYSHPSVVLWSIGNEIPEQSNEDGQKIAAFLTEICHREDTTRMVTSACDNIAAIETFRTSREFEKTLDVVGYNYAGRWRERAETFFEEDREAYPDRCFIGTENPSAGGVRGDYNVNGGFHGHSYTTQTMGHEALWRYEASHDFVSGDYLWTGIDYLGEARWPLRGAMCGPIDSAGFRKDTFYYFRSIWKTDDVTLHLLPHWNFEGEEGVFKTVIAYTNCQYVDLYINNRFVGRRGYYACPRYGCTKTWLDCFDQHPTTNDLHLTWDVPYEKGTLRAEGIIDGKVVAVEEVRTTGKGVTLHAVADNASVKTDGFARIVLYETDAEGMEVPDAVPVVTAEVDGPGRLIGLDGGDMSDLTVYSAPSRRMFAGKLAALVRAEGPGEITVRFVTDDGLKAECVLKAE